MFFLKKCAYDYFYRIYDCDIAGVLHLEEKEKGVKGKDADCPPDTTTIILQ